MSLKPQLVQDVDPMLKLSTRGNGPSKKEEIWVGTYFEMDFIVSSIKTSSSSRYLKTTNKLHRLDARWRSSGDLKDRNAGWKNLIAHLNGGNRSEVLEMKIRMMYDNIILRQNMNQTSVVEEKNQRLMNESNHTIVFVLWDVI